MSEPSLRQRLELGIELLDSAIKQVQSLPRWEKDSLVQVWYKELINRKTVLVGQLQLLALEDTDALAKLVQEE